MFSFIGGCGAFGSGTESTGTLWDSGGCGKRKPAGNVDSAQSREGKVLSIDCTPERAFRRDALCWDDARYWRWGVIVGAEHECWLKGESLQKRHNRSGFEAEMMRELIPVEESFAEWRKDPEYVAAYGALEGGVCAGFGFDQGAGRCGYDAGAGGCGDGDDAGGGGAAGEREDDAFNADAGAVCQGYGDEVADSV